MQAAVAILLFTKADFKPKLFKKDGEDYFTIIVRLRVRAL